MSAVSPLAPSSFQELPPVDGVRLGAMEAGIKYKGRHDLALWLLDAKARPSPAPSPNR